MLFFLLRLLCNIRTFAKCANRSSCFKSQANTIRNQIVDVSTTEHEIDSIYTKQNLTTDLNAGVISAILPANILRLKGNAVAAAVSKKGKETTTFSVSGASLLYCQQLDRRAA